MEHHFNVEIAREYGVNVAIFLNNLAYWIHKNLANKKNIHEGTCWTYNSQAAFTVLFPYWSRQNLRKIIKESIDGGLLKTGNFNESKRDQTKWYALTEKGLALFPILQKDHDSIIKEQNQGDKTLVGINQHSGWNQPAQWLESTSVYKETDNKPNNKPNKKLSSASDEASKSFEQFKLIYPRQNDMSKAFKIWIKDKLYLIADEIIEKLKVQIANDPQWQDPKFIPYPSTYLRNKRWQDEITLQRIKPEKEHPVNRAMRLAMGNVTNNSLDYDGVL